MKMNYFLLIFAVVLEVISFSGVPVARAAVYFMTDAGEKRGTLDISDAGQNKGTVVVIGADGKEVTLGGGGSCGMLCAVLTIKDGAVFGETINAKTYAISMANPELATESVGKTLGIVSTDGVNAIIGLADSKDARTDALITDMAGVLNDIAILKAQLAAMQSQVVAKKEVNANICTSLVIAGIFKEARIVGDTAKGEWTLK